MNLKFNNLTFFVKLKISFFFCNIFVLYLICCFLFGLRSSLQWSQVVAYGNIDSSHAV